MNCNLRLWRFAQEYISSYDPTQSAIIAGYSKRSARSTAYRLLQEPYVQKIIKRHQLDVEAKCLVDRDELIAQLLRVTKANLHDYLAMNRNGSLRYKNREELNQMPDISLVRSIRSNFKGETIGLELECKLTAIDTLLKMLPDPQEPLEEPSGSAETQHATYDSVAPLPTPESLAELTESLPAPDVTLFAYQPSQEIRSDVQRGV